jgi:hypothetical protein
MRTIDLDKTPERLIVIDNQVNTKTPPDGAINTRRGLTGQADSDSMAAEGNSNVELSSRQSLSTAADDFSVSRQVEYCPPTDKVVNAFADEVCEALNGQDQSTIAVRQEFKQFMIVVARIVAKQANTEVLHEA